MSLIHQKIPSEEVEDSSSKSLANHEGSRRFFPSGSHIYTTSQQVSHPRASSERQKIYTYSLVSFSTIPCESNNQDYSCTYPLEIEHVGTVEKGRDSERERDQGQPEARASPEKDKRNQLSEEV